MLRLRLLFLIIALLPVSGVARADEEAAIRTLLDEGRLEDALAAADQALLARGGDPQFQFLRGLVLAQMGRAEEAIATFETLTKEHPELPEPLNNLAVLHAARGDFDRARDALLQAIALHPSYAVAHENLGDIYARMAQISYRRASALDDSNYTVRDKLARLDGVLTRDARVAPAVTEPAVTQRTVTEPAVTEPAVSQPSVVSALEQPSSDVTVQATELRSAVDTWAMAWSRQDVDTYLDSYADDFRPSNGHSRERWQAQRRRRITAPSFIELDISGLEVQETGQDRARITFQQRYRSDGYSDAVLKELVLVRQHGRWRIQSESVLGTL